MKWSCFKPFTFILKHIAGLCVSCRNVFFSQQNGVLKWCWNYWQSKQMNIFYAWMHTKIMLPRADCRDRNSRVQAFQSMGCCCALIWYTSFSSTYIMIYCNIFYHWTSAMFSAVAVNSSSVLCSVLVIDNVSRPSSEDGINNFAMGFSMIWITWQIKFQTKWLSLAELKRYLKMGF